MSSANNTQIIDLDVTERRWLPIGSRGKCRGAGSEEPDNESISGLETDRNRTQHSAAKVTLLVTAEFAHIPA
eukprot:4255796-Pyramimonas_sp.AAC.1